jgi:DNA-binding MurR/RpiR family transcriptional regulator
MDPIVVSQTQLKGALANHISYRNLYNKSLRDSSVHNLNLLFKSNKASQDSLTKAVNEKIIDKALESIYDKKDTLVVNATTQGINS